MKTYDVTIEVKAVHVIPVEAETEDDAMEQAYRMLDPDDLEFQTYYTENVIQVEEVK